MKAELTAVASNLDGPAMSMSSYPLSRALSFPPSLPPLSVFALFLSLPPSLSSDSVAAPNASVGKHQIRHTIHRDFADVPVTARGLSYGIMVEYKSRFFGQQSEIDTSTDSYNVFFFFLFCVTVSQIILSRACGSTAIHGIVRHSTDSTAVECIRQHSGVHLSGTALEHHRV